MIWLLNLIRLVLMIIYGKYCIEYISSMESSFLYLNKFIMIVFMIMIWQFIYTFTQLIYNGLNE